jgi:hypothetical protein
VDSHRTFLESWLKTELGSNKTELRANQTDKKRNNLKNRDGGGFSFFCSDTQLLPDFFFKSQPNPNFFSNPNWAPPPLLREPDWDLK